MMNLHRLMKFIFQIINYFQKPTINNRKLKHTHKTLRDLDNMDMANEPKAPGMIDNASSAERQNPNGQQPLRRTLSFDQRVKVILVPTKQEIIDAELKDVLWWDNHDYCKFKIEAVQEIAAYAQKKKIPAFTAITELYQPEPKRIKPRSILKNKEGINAVCSDNIALTSLEKTDLNLVGQSIFKQQTRSADLDIGQKNMKNDSCSSVHESGFMSIEAV